MQDHTADTVQNTGGTIAAAVASVEIARSPEDVFAYVLEPLYSAEWDDSVVSASRADPAPIAVGSKTVVLHRFGRWKVPTVEEVTELDAPRRFTNRGVSGPLAGIAKSTVEPLDGGRRSRLTVTLDIEASGLGWLLLPFGRARARQVLPKQLERIKAVLDSKGQR